jgi:hypothetical protein
MEQAISLIGPNRAGLEENNDNTGTRQATSDDPVG